MAFVFVKLLFFLYDCLKDFILTGGFMKNLVLIGVSALFLVSCEDRTRSDLTPGQEQVEKMRKEEKMKADERPAASTGMTAPAAPVKPLDK